MSASDSRLPISGGRRLAWVCAMRMAALLGAAALTWLVAGSGASVASGPILTILLALFAVNLALFVLYWNGRIAEWPVARQQHLIHFQVVLDLAGLTALCHYAGGAENPFYVFFAFPVLYAATLLSRRAAFGYATLASLLYAGLVVAEGTDRIAHHHLAGLHDMGLYQRVPLLLGQILALTAICVLGAAVTSLLVGALRSRAAELEEGRRRTELRSEHVQTLNEQLHAANEEARHQRLHLDMAYEELQRAHDRLQIRSSHMSELNEQLRVANAECKAKREELAEAGTRLEETYRRLEVRSEHMQQLNDLLRDANAECRSRRVELEQLNAELAIANEKLRKLEDVRSQFTLLVTHELRAPVAAIQSYLKLILEGYVPEAKVRETLEKAERRAMEQLALIADLLELGRIGSADARGLVQRLQLELLLTEQLELLSGAASLRGITIRTEVAPDLPAVMANPEQIRSLWNNLVSNAIKYNVDGGSVLIGIVHAGDRIVAEVIDTGIGIPEEAKTRLFSEFFRADNAKAVSRMGTGLGLSIVKEIVERAGGKIEVESELGKGTTFRFWLPTFEPVAGVLDAAGLPASVA